MKTVIVRFIFSRKTTVLVLLGCLVSLFTPSLSFAGKYDEGTINIFENIDIFLAVWLKNLFPMEGIADRVLALTLLIYVILLTTFALMAFKRQAHKIIEAEAKQREQYFTLYGIMENINGFVFSLDKQFCYTSFNREHSVVMKTLYGADIQLGRNLLECMTVAEDREIAKQNLSRALAGEQVVEEAFSGDELRTRRYFRVLHSPIKMGEDIIGVAVLAHDVTERKNKEMELQKIQSNRQAILNALPDLMFVLKRDGTYASIGGRTNELYLPEEELLGKKINETLPAELAAQVMEAIEKTMEHGFHSFEYQLCIHGKMQHYETRSVICGEDEVLSICRNITSRKTMEDELRRSEENFAKVFHLCPDAITCSGMDGAYIQVNEGFTIMSGYLEKEAVGKNAVDLGIWVDGKDWERMVEGLKSQGKIRNQDTLFRRKDGTIVQGLLSARVVNINGEHRVLAFVRDVTEEKRDEACQAILHHISTQILGEVPLADILNYLCEQLVRVFDLSLARIGWKMPDGTVRVDAEAGTQVWYCNQVTSRWDEEVDRICPIAFVLRTGQKLVLQTPQEMRNRQKNLSSRSDTDWGEPRSCAAFPLLIQGIPICGLGLVSRYEHFWDERMLARLDNFSSQLAVAIDAAQRREQLNLLRTGLESTANAVGITDKEGNIEWVNPAFVKMSGYDYAELIGRNVRSIKVSFSDLKHAEQSRQQIEDIVMAGKSWHGELNLWRKDGGFQTADTTITLIMNERGEIVNRIVMYHDISEKKLAQEAVQEAKEAKTRAEKLFSLGALSAGISHEINQPLNSIKMLASGIVYAHNNGRDQGIEEVIPKIEEISCQVDRINSIVSQLRLLMRRGDLPAEPCDLNEAIRLSLSLADKQLAGSGIHVQTYLQEGLPRIIAMMTALEEIIGNLLVNAIQALDTMGMQEKVIVIRTYFDCGVIFTLSDNGPGISKEMGGRIFEPLFSGKSGKNNLGLGLAIVKSLVASFGGTICFESEENVGTTFIVKFPV